MSLLAMRQTEAVVVTQEAEGVVVGIVSELCASVRIPSRGDHWTFPGD